MAFKSKIKPEDLKDLTEVNYIKLTQKEVKRAAKFGETGVVILSDYEFACGSVGTMLLLGKMSGPLMKYYKQIKKERAKEKDFAKGTCYFEDGDNPIMRIALDDGKGKPNKMEKNGKKLLKKLGLAVEIFKGDLGLEDETLDDEELTEIEDQVDEENEDQKMKKILKAYKKAFAMVAANVIPALKAKEGITEQHYQLALQLLKLSKSAQDKLEEINEKQQAKYADLVNDIKSREPKVIKIVANLKKMLADNTVEGDLEEVLTSGIISNQRREQISIALNNLEEKFEEIKSSLS